MARRSPVRVEKHKLALGITSLRWVCDARLQAAEFQDRRDPLVSIIVHRSPKRAGTWQTSRFDSKGASGDFESSTCQEAMQDLSPRQWRLRSVSPKR